MLHCVLTDWIVADTHLTAGLARLDVVGLEVRQVLRAPFWGKRFATRRINRLSARVVILASIAIGSAAGLVPYAAASPLALGYDWIVQSDFGAMLPSSIAFADEMNGCAVAPGGMVICTHDGGTAWVPYVLPAGSNYSDYGWSRIRFFDSTRGAILVDCSHMVLSSDAGLTWQATSLPDSPACVNDVASSQPGTLFALQGATISISTDNGTTWQTVYDNPAWAGLNPQISGLVFANATDGWATGAQPLHTVDGGRTWQPASFTETDLGMWLFPAITLAVLPESQGLALGRSINDGTSFTYEPLPVDASPLSMVFLDPLHGMFSNRYPAVVYSTQDGGLTWQAETARNGAGEVGYRGNVPYAVSGSQFLHLGPLPTTSTPLPSLTPTLLPSSTPTEPLVVPLPTRVLQPYPTPSPTPVPVDILGIEPKNVVAGSGTSITVRGSGFDNTATVSIGPDDITDITCTQQAGSEQIAFSLPGTIRAGTYDVTVTEPDGRSQTLRKALTIAPKLTVTARLLHTTVIVGNSTAALVQSVQGAHIALKITNAAGQTATGISTRLQAGVDGQWRAALTTSAAVAAGVYRVTLTASLGAQHCQIVLTLKLLARRG